MYYKKIPDIAVIIPSFTRINKTIEEIKSIRRYYPTTIRFYVGNQDKFNIREMGFFKELEKEGHKIYNLPFNCGLSFARNFLIKQSTEPYILIIDNDFDFYEQTNLNTLKQVLNEDKYIGISAGRVNNRDIHTYDMYLDNINHQFYLIDKESREWKTTKEYPYIKYYYSQLALNFFLAKREIFEDIMWDERLKMVEHNDFFFRLKKTKWKVTYVPSVVVNHQMKDDTSKYAKTRTDNKRDSWKIYLEKMGLKTLKDLHKVSEHKFRELKSKNFKIEIETSKDDTIQKAVYTKKNLMLIKELQKYNKYICLLGETCHRWVVYGDLETPRLEVAVDNPKYSKEKIGENISYKNMPENTKIFNKNHLEVLVSFPVVDYLLKQGYEDVLTIIKRDK